jgi:DNA-binding transcriptional LysR family regulator
MAKTVASWDLYRTFLEVVRDGSLSAAARRLGLTQPTVGRHIAALERSIGAALFTRSQRGLLPTRAALELVPHAEAMAAAEAAFRRTASGEASVIGGSVRITASEIMGCEVLPPILARFCAAHPAIEVELAVSNRVQDLLRRDADIAVRGGRPTQTALIARRIGVLRIGLFAYRAYVKTRGFPTDVADLARHRLIGFDGDSTSFSAIGETGLGVTRDTFGFRTDSDPAQLAALRAGVGIAGCQHQIAARDKQLVPILPDKISFRLEIWLAMHEDLRATQRVRLMFDHLAKELASYVRPAGVQGPAGRARGVPS